PNIHPPSCLSLNAFNSEIQADDVEGLGDSCLSKLYNNDSP
ncbi:13970_t:CDS:1, partial [Cetraspora pellucida]